MARILCNVAGGGKPLKGNAETGDVLAGKTFSNKQSNALTGTMPNNGVLNITLTPSGNNSTSQAVAAGYYSGGTITANGSSSYSQGVSDADKRVNTSSASYNSGYTNGHAAKKSTTLTISLNMWSSHNDEGTHWHADVSVNGSHVCGAEQGGATGYYTVTL